MRLVAVALVIFLVIGGASALFMLSTNTAVEMTPVVKTIGVSTPVAFKLTNPHGVRSVAAYLEQGGARYPLLEQSVPARRFFWTRHVAPKAVAFDAGKVKVPNLKEGQARIVVETVSNDFRGATNTAAYDVNVALAPPRVTPDGLQHYVNQGGMELVTFTTGGSWSDAGVKVKDNRSFPRFSALPAKDQLHL